MKGMLTLESGRDPDSAGSILCQKLLCLDRGTQPPTNGESALCLCPSVC